METLTLQLALIGDLTPTPTWVKENENTLCRASSASKHVLGEKKRTEEGPTRGSSEAAKQLKATRQSLLKLLQLHSIFYVLHITD